MLYKLSYYFFSILQFFSEMLKQKSSVVLFLVPLFYSDKKVLGEGKGNFNQGSPLSVDFSVYHSVSVFAEKKTGN